jgi:hypothetical protein
MRGAGGGVLVESLAPAVIPLTEKTCCIAKTATRSFITFISTADVNAINKSVSLERATNCLPSCLKGICMTPAPVMLLRCNKEENFHGSVPKGRPLGRITFDGAAIRYKIALSAEIMTKKSPKKICTQAFCQNAEE